MRYRPDARRHVPLVIGWVLLIASLASGEAAADGANEKADGYRGIWFTLGQFSKHGDKYSGGLGTYTANHNPIAVYSPAADRTFFTYGGTQGPAAPADHGVVLRPQDRPGASTDDRP